MKRFSTFWRSSLSWSILALNLALQPQPLIWFTYQIANYFLNWHANIKSKFSIFVWNFTCYCLFHLNPRFADCHAFGNNYCNKQLFHLNMSSGPIFFHTTWPIFQQINFILIVRLFYFSVYFITIDKLKPNNNYYSVDFRSLKCAGIVASYLLCIFRGSICVAFTNSKNADNSFECKFWYNKRTMEGIVVCISFLIKFQRQIQ